MQQKSQTSSEIANLRYLTLFTIIADTNKALEKHTLMHVEEINEFKTYVEKFTEQRKRLLNKHV